MGARNADCLQGEAQLVGAALGDTPSTRASEIPSYVTIWRIVAGIASDSDVSPAEPS